jgi:glycine/D-amino acid oxidase-like deaminating enzyme/nitrite reductase/ring-hydroxylating ferredoxin subunit
MNRPKSGSYWTQSASLPRFPRVDTDVTADVIVVGAGLTGLTAAYLLAKAGQSVIVLERDRLAQNDTAHTSAHLTMVTDATFSELTARFGEDHAQAVWDAGLAAIAQIDEIVRDESIACDFTWVPGYRHRGLTTPDVNLTNLFAREAQLASKRGFDVSLIDEVPLVGGRGLRFERQARFHPRKYLAGLVRAIVRHGGKVYEHSAAEAFSATPLTVTSNNRTLSCREIVIATHDPLVGNTNPTAATLFQTKLALYTTYVVAGRVARGAVPDALMWDTEQPYHYLRIEPHRSHDLVIFGGADHKTGQARDTRECFHEIEHTLVKMLPGVEVTYRWSGQVIATPDGLPYIGRTADHQFVGTGFSGNGLTFGTLTAMMAADHVAERKNPWTELLDPGRTTLSAAWDYVTENKDYPFYLIRDRFAGTGGRSLRDVPRHEGRVVTLGNSPAAVYRADDGSTSVRSAVCSHMGCLVGWNQAEGTWDCPCHGSRFKTNGDVISGPAEAPLAKLEEQSGA